MKNKMSTILTYISKIQSSENDKKLTIGKSVSSNKKTYAVIVLHYICDNVTFLILENSISGSKFLESTMVLRILTDVMNHFSWGTLAMRGI